MVLTFTGSNSYLLQVAVRSRVDAFIKDHGDFGVERLDGEDAPLARITESLQSMPFLVDRKLVILRNPSLQKAFAEQFEALLPTIPDAIEVIILETKLDKRTAYYKWLKKLTDFTEYNDLAEPQLKSWLVTRAHEQGGKLSNNDAGYLIERVGPNQQNLGNEIDKLVNYDPAITCDTIDLLTELSPQSTVFELLDAAFAGRHKLALALYAEQRALKVEPLAIMAMIGWQLHVLLILKTGGSRSVDDIARASKLNPYVARKSQNLASRLSFAELKDLLNRTLELDVALKSQSIDADEALQNLILSLA